MEDLRRKRDAEREEKLDFEILDLRVMPSDEALKGEPRPQSHVKPGHWFAAVQEVIANNSDFPKGDLDSQCIDESVNPIKLPGGEFELRTTRAVSLPKGQQKNVDIVLFASTQLPKKSSGNFSNTSKRMYFRSRLTPRGGGRQLDWKHELAINMKGCQNHFVVLADRSDNYQFLKNLPLVVPAREDFLSQAVDYHVKLPKGTQRVDLSPHSLTWTTVAYLLWDDFDPDVLSLGQQQAILDWLHWGGQLVVSGPKTLDRLSASFLGKYLPARAGKTSKLSDEQVKSLNAEWSFDVDPALSKNRNPADKRDGSKPDRQPMKFALEVEDEKDRPLCIELKLIGNGQFVEKSAQLVAESYVGRGCIRVSAFNLPHPLFRRWASYDSFINSGLLGRPSRQYFLSNQTGEITENWERRIRVSRDDPRATSSVRYFSRDASTSVVRKSKSRLKKIDDQKSLLEDGSENSPDAALLTDAPAVDSPEAATEKDVQMPAVASVTHALPVQARGTYMVNGYARDDQTGVAAWSDSSDVSQLAVDALRIAAGVDVPASSFIAKAIGLYLLILVPVNWCLFRLMGRVEWAWAMVPLLSIGGAIGVLRATQLDIGFVRSRTEVGVIEMQPGYDRAHVTRYIGFYTSLAVPYELTGENSSTLILPVANANEARTSRNVDLRVGDEVKMTGFSVKSNSTGMVHAEQMINVGGSIELKDDSQVINGSNLDLQGAIVVRRTNNDAVEFAVVGQLSAGKTYADLQFRPITTDLIVNESWEADPTTAYGSVEGLNIRPLVDLASAPDRLGLGERLLVGWTDKLLPGITVKPSAAQVVARSVVVAQLKHPERIKPQRDANSFFKLKFQAKDIQDRSGI